MNLEKYFPKEEIELASKLITAFHEDYFLESKITDKKAIILVTYMLANKNKKNSILIKEAREFFVKFGRKEKSFLNRLSEIKKSKKGL